MPYCPKCGTEVSADAKFCTNCGATLGMAAPAPSAPMPSGYTPPSPLADLGSRVVAGLIDYIIIGIIAVILFFAAFASLFAAPYFMMGVSPAAWGLFGGLFGIQFLLWLIYFTYFEGTSGQTFGKKFAHVKVVKVDGSRCDFGSALLRSILRIIDSLPAIYILGIILIAATDKRQRLGDMLARTIVVKA
jgi:uncharacterized RDD family membrane protein YckC